MAHVLESIIFKFTKTMLRWAVNCSKWNPTPQEWLIALGCLQQEEVERVGSFVYQRDSKLALVGRLLIRAALITLTHLTNEDIILTRSEKGKPLLVREGVIDNSIGFNLSHQGDYAVLAAEKDTPVGVDVMQFSQPRGTTLTEFFSTMKRQFTAREWEQIQHPHTQHLSNFYRFWCLKESFIKAEGSGLSYGLQNLEFHTDSSLPWPPPSHVDVYQNTQLFVRGQLCDKWMFEESLIDNEHCAAVATNKPHPQTTPTFNHQSVSSLLSTVSSFPSRLVEEKLWTQFNSKDKHYNPQ